MKQQFYPIPALEQELQRVLKAMYTANVGDEVPFNGNIKKSYKVKKNGYGSPYVEISVCNGYDLRIIKRTDRTDSFIIDNYMTFWRQKDDRGPGRPLRFRAFAQVSKANGKISVFIWDEGNETFSNNRNQESSYDSTEVAAEPDLC